MAKPNHYMRGNKSSALPQQIVVLSVVPISIATPPERTIYADVCAAWATASWRNRAKSVHGRTECSGNSAVSFWQWLDCLLTTERTTWVFCHRIGTGMELLGFWKQVDNNTIDISSTLRDCYSKHCDSRPKQQNAIVCTEDPPTILRWYRPSDQATCIMLDTRNYWPDWQPQSTLPGALDHDGNYSRQVYPDECVRLATKRAGETELMLLKYIEFVKDNDLGMFRYSIAGQSKAAYRHRFLTHKILVHQNADARKIERNGYYGGQTEVYQIGQIQGPLYKVDVNGLFPYIMSSKLLPQIIKDHCHDDGHPRRLPPMVPLDQAICTVTVNTDNTTYPARRKGRVLFATGYFRTTLAGPELQRAYNAGHIVAWHDWCHYECSDILRDFSCKMWELRRVYRAASDDIVSHWCKMIANSLYGKTVQWKPRWQEIIGTKAYPRWGHTYVHWPEYKLIKTYRAIAGQLYELAGKEEHPDAVPSIGAFITAYAREHMRALREKAGQDNVIFQVVDCLLLNQAGYNNLCKSESFNPEELGALRVVDEYKVVDVLGSNYYCHDGTWVSSGISHRVVRSDERGWSVEIEDRIDTTIDTPPDDVHITKVRHHVMPHLTTVRSDGKVATPYIDDSCVNGYASF